MQTVEELNGLNDSLQKEFEFFAASDNSEKTLQAKKRQQAAVKQLKDLNSSLYSQVIRLDEYIFSLQACLLYYGVSPRDIDAFTNRHNNRIQLDVQTFIQKNVVHIPGKIQLALNLNDPESQLWDHLEKTLLSAEEKSKTIPQTQKPRFANKPVMNWESINKKQTA